MGTLRTRILKVLILLVNASDQFVAMGTLRTRILKDTTYKIVEVIGDKSQWARSARGY